MCFQKKKKMDRGVGGCGLANLSFSRIFGFFFYLTRPLSKHINPLMFLIHVQLESIKVSILMSDDFSS